MLCRKDDTATVLESTAGCAVLFYRRMMMGTEAANDNIEIVIRDVEMIFKDNSGNDVPALQDVNLDIRKGEFISLLGPSGCGKTTLLRMISDLQQPTEGKIRIGGMTPREVRMNRKFGFVFQQPVLFDWRTVRRNIELPLEIMKYSRVEMKKTSDEMLEMVGLSSFADNYPKQLSGGMQQRVNIARAFGIDPEILLMDEPFSALDEFTKDKLHEDLLSIWRKTNKTIVFVTHNIQEAVFLSDRVCIFTPHPGKLSAVVDIDLPRPRTMEIRNTPHFNELVIKVRNSFRGGSL